ncbi:MAG: winged helix-turn-helix domain-containing protein [Myxococcota bacterium]
MLAFFAKHPDEDIPRERLLEDVMGYAPNVRSRAVDDAIKRLRKKIERYPARPFHLISVRGVGYRFVPLREAQAPRERLPLTDREIDLGRLEVLGPGANKARLSALEGRLLEALSQSPGVIQATETLLWAVWGTRNLKRRPMLSSLVYRLRTKIEPDVDAPTVLVTVRGRGVQLNLPDVTTPTAQGGDRCRPPMVELLGREAPLQTLRAWFGRGDRLVSLLGTAGVGKSTLARQLGSEDPDNARVVDLSAATDEADVERAIADALGLDGPALIADATAEWPALLLILDNAESALSACGAVVARLLARCPARFLVTSRRPLRIRAERRLVLSPLTAPVGEALLRKRLADLGVPERSEDEQSAIPELVAALDRLPLAINLAAAQVRMFGVRGLLERLDAAQTILRAPAPDVPARHHSLSAALSVSWEALSAEEQRFLCGCTVFIGGFSLRDAESVLGPDRVIHLEALLDANLIQMSPDDGEPRFSLFAIVRRFAAPRLSDMDRARLQDRHLDWICSLGADIEIGEMPPLERLPELSRVTRDARHAVSAAIMAGDPERAARCLLWLLPVQGYRAMPAAAVALVDALHPLRDQIAPRLWWWLSYLSMRARRTMMPANQLFAEIRHLTERARRSGWPTLARFGVMILGGIHAAEHRLEDARQMLALAEADADTSTQQGRLRLAYLRGLILHMEGQIEAAWRAYLHALTTARQLQDRWWTGYLAKSLAWLAFIQDNLAECESWLAESIEIFEPVGERTHLDDTYGILGALRIRQGRLDEAITLLETASQQMRRSGQLGNLNDTLHSLGDAYACVGRYQDARRIFTNLIATYGRSESLTRVFWSSFQLSLIDVLEGAPVDAVYRLQGCLPLFENLDDPRAEGFCNLALYQSIQQLPRPDRDRDRMRQALARTRRAWRRLPEPAGYLLLVDAWRAELENDRGAVDALLARMRADPVKDGVRVEILSAIGLIHAHHGHAEDIRQIRDEIEAMAFNDGFTWTDIVMKRFMSVA